MSASKKMWGVAATGTGDGDRGPGLSRRNHSSVLEACGWLAAAVCVMLTQSIFLPAGSTWPTVLLGALSWLLGVRIFVGHGGSVITVPSIWGFAFSIFFGVGGVYHGLLAPDSDMHPWLVIALLITFTSQVLVFFGFWRRHPAEVLAPGVASVSSGAAALAAVAGGSVFAITLILRSAYAWSAQTQVLITSAALAAVVLLTAGLILSDSARILSLRTLLVCTLFGLYVQYMHVGSGRLHITTLGFAIIVIYALRFRTVAFKYGVILITAPVLSWMAEDRLVFIDTIPGGSSANRTGLESAVRPLYAFAELLHSYRSFGFELSHGKTFLTVPAMLVPDRLWIDKPLAFGYESVRITSPGRFGTGYSDASSLYGEFFFNFGYLGLVLIIPAIGLVLPLMDRLLVRVVRPGHTEFTQLLRIAILVVVCSGVSDLLWSGTHTYGVRTLIRLPLLVVPLLAISAGRWLRTSRDRGSPMRSLGSKKTTTPHIRQRNRSPNDQHQMRRHSLPPR